MATIQAAKKELRKQIKHSLSSLAPETVASQTTNAVRTLLALPEYQAAKRISVYLSMPSGEISTAAIVQDALDQGKKVFIPYTYQRSHSELRPKSIMDMVELHGSKDYEEFQSDKWGIPTPSADSIPTRANSFGGLGRSEADTTPQPASESGLDLIVVPGMTFDAGLGRLGHGKGFYDYFLDRCAQQSEQVKGVRMPFLVGLALKEQLLSSGETVPMDSTDWRLDALITGTGEILRSRKPDPTHRS